MEDRGALLLDKSARKRRIQKWYDLGCSKCKGWVTKNPGRHWLSEKFKWTSGLLIQFLNNVEKRALNLGLASNVDSNGEPCLGGANTTTKAAPIAAARPEPPMIGYM
jgi:hypothetical protein